MEGIAFPFPGEMIREKGVSGRDIHKRMRPECFLSDFGLHFKIAKGDICNL